MVSRADGPTTFDAAAMQVVPGEPVDTLSVAPIPPAVASNPALLEQEILRSVMMSL